MAEPRESPERRPGSARRGSHLLVQAGEYVCALPLGSVRRVVRVAAPSTRCRARRPELEGLAEFGGEPLPVLDLARLVDAPPGANPAYPVTIVVWVGPPDAREMIGLAADAALEVVRRAARSSVVGGDGGFLLGEAPVAGEVVRVLNLEALGRESVSAPAAAPAGFLLLRRGGRASGGSPTRAVEGLARQGGGYRIAVGRRGRSAPTRSSAWWRTCAVLAARAGAAAVLARGGGAAWRCTARRRW